MRLAPILTIPLPLLSATSSARVGRIYTGSVMKTTRRMVWPQRGQSRGRMSWIRVGNIAQR